MDKGFWGDCNPEGESLRRGLEDLSPPRAEVPLTRPMRGAEASPEQPNPGDDVTDQTAVDGTARALQYSRGAGPPRQQHPSEQAVIEYVRPRRSRQARSAGPPAHTETPDKAPAPRRPIPDMVVIEALAESGQKEAGTPELPTNTRPDVDKVAQNARAGRPSARVFGWIGGRVRAEVTPDLVPQGAVTSERPPEEHQPAQAGVPAEAADPTKKFTWARLKAVLGHPANPAQTANESTPQHRSPLADLKELTRVFRDTDFAVALVGDGVPQEGIDSRLAIASWRAANLDKTELDPRAKEKKGAAYEQVTTYVEGNNSALMRESIAIGAEPGNLERVAREAARVHSSRRPMRFEVEEGPDGRVRQYSDMETAAAVSTGVPVTAAEFVERAQLPDPPLPGLGRVPAPTNLDVDRRVPKGANTLAFAEILDNDGKPTGRPLEMTREHTLVIAETEAGKSVLLRKIITEIQGQNYARMKAAKAAGKTDWEHEAVLVLDCKTEHGFSYQVSRQIGGIKDDSGESIPDEMATVHRYAPGGDGPGVRFNLLKSVGITAQSWRRRIGMTVEVVTSKYKAMDPDTYRSIKKYFRQTLFRSCRTFGLNPKTGKSMYPHGTPATPTGEFLAEQVEETVNSDSTAVSKDNHWKNNVIGWVKDETHSIFSGDNGAPLAAEGYDLNAMAVLKNKGVTSVEFMNIRDESSRKVAVLGQLYEMYDACVEMNRLEGIVGPVDKTRLTIIIDEADVFGKDPLGAALADFCSYARHVGLKLVIAKQGDVENTINAQVLVNTPNKIWLRTSFKGDVAVFADSAGRTTLQDVQHLPGAAKGQGVYKGPGMERAVGFRVADPGLEPMSDRAIVVGPEALIDRGSDPEVFDRELKIEAREFLVDDPLGLKISNWAEENTIFLASGRAISDITSELETSVRAQMQDPATRDKLRCAIAEAAKNSVDSRPDLQYVASRKEYTDHLVKHMLAIADGQKLPGWDKPRPELALNVGKPNPDYNPDAPDTDNNKWKKYHVMIDGRFGAVKDKLNDQMTAGEHGEAEQMSQAIGKPLLGDTANEQYDFAVRVKMDAVNRLVRNVKSLAGTGQLSPSAQAALRDDIEKLVGGQIPHDSSAQDVLFAEDEEDYIREVSLDTISRVAAEVLREKDYQMSKAETEALGDFIEDLPIVHLTKPTGYLTVEAKLVQLIDEYKKNAPGLSPDEVEQLCGHRIEGTAYEQFTIIEQQLEQAAVAAMPYAGRVKPTQIFFAIDRLRGSGATYDNNIAAVQAMMDDSSDVIQRSIRVKGGELPDVDYTVSGQLTAGDNSPWQYNFSKHVLYSDDFDRTPAKTRYLVERFDGITTSWQVKPKVAK